MKGVTEFIVDGCDVIMIRDGKVLRSGHFKTHKIAEKIRNEIVADFWGIREYHKN